MIHFDNYDFLLEAEIQFQDKLSKFFLKILSALLESTSRATRWQILPFVHQKASLFYNSKIMFQN